MEGLKVDHPSHRANTKCIYVIYLLFTWKFTCCVPEPVTAVITKSESEKMQKITFLPFVLVLLQMRMLTQAVI